MHSATRPTIISPNPPLFNVPLLRLENVRQTQVSIPLFSAQNEDSIHPFSIIALVLPLVSAFTLTLSTPSVVSDGSINVTWTTNSTDPYVGLFLHHFVVNNHA